MSLNNAVRRYRCTCGFTVSYDENQFSDATREVINGHELRTGHSMFPEHDDLSTATV